MRIVQSATLRVSRLYHEVRLRGLGSGELIARGKMNVPARRAGHGPAPTDERAMRAFGEHDRRRNRAWQATPLHDDATNAISSPPLRFGKGPTMERGPGGEAVPRFRVFRDLRGLRVPVPSCSPLHPQMGRGRGWGRPKRGQALAEFALIMPVFIGLLFGLAEMAMVYGTAAMYNMAAAQAARYEALAAASAGNVDQTTANGIITMTKPYFVAHVVRIEVYRSDAQGDGPQAGAETIFDGTGAMQSQTFLVSSRTSSVAQPLYIGVRVTYSYTWLTSFVGATGATLTLQANAVAPVQPVGG